MEWYPGVFGRAGDGPPSAWRVAVVLSGGGGGGGGRGEDTCPSLSFRCRVAIAVLSRAALSCPSLLAPLCRIGRTRQSGARVDGALRTAAKRRGRGRRRRGRRIERTIRPPARPPSVGRQGGICRADAGQTLVKHWSNTGQNGCISPAPTGEIHESIHPRAELVKRSARQCVA